MLTRSKRESGPDVAQLTIAIGGTLLVGVLYLVLPDKLTIGPNWLLLAVLVALALPTVLSAVLFGRRLPFGLTRKLALVTLTILTVALIGSLILLVHSLASPNLKAVVLLRAGAVLWGCTVLVFATWYWEIDGGGPVARHRAGHVAADFQFPQQAGGKPQRWAPGFIDYLFLGFCSATALSPADTMPLTQRAKLLMMVEALCSMSILVLLISRFVNIV